MILLSQVNFYAVLCVLLINLLILKAEIKEEMQQLRATINILIEQKPRRTKSPNTHNDDHKGNYCKRMRNQDV